jgi:tRNA dimethylallyltransferase
MSSDPQRIVRALEVLEATGRSLLHWQLVAGEALLSPADAELLCVSPQRETLYARCDARLDAMIEAGALEEVRGLAALELDPGLPAMRALGVRPMLAHLRGMLTLDAALAAAKTETRRYAKRQLTWHKRNMIAW